MCPVRSNYHFFLRAELFRILSPTRAFLGARGSDLNKRFTVTQNTWILSAARVGGYMRHECISPSNHLCMTLSSLRTPHSTTTTTTMIQPRGVYLEFELMGGGQPQQPSHIFPRPLKTHVLRADTIYNTRNRSCPCQSRCVHGV